MELWPICQLAKISWWACHKLHLRFPANLRWSCFKLAISVWNCDRYANCTCLFIYPVNEVLPHAGCYPKPVSLMQQWRGLSVKKETQMYKTAKHIHSIIVLFMSNYVQHNLDSCRTGKSTIIFILINAPSLINTINTPHTSYGKKVAKWHHNWPYVLIRAKHGGRTQHAYR